MNDDEILAAVWAELLIAVSSLRAQGYQVLMPTSVELVRG